MGGYTIDRVFDGSLTRSDVEKEIRLRKSDDAHEMGVGRGLDGIHFRFITDPRLKTDEDVRQAYENLEKCSGVVIHVLQSAVPHDKRGPLKPFEDAVRAAHTELSALGPTILKRLAAQTSKTRGCQTCGSSIAVAYLKVTHRRWPKTGATLACPVCLTDDFVFTQADHARQARLEKACADADVGLKTAETKLAAQSAKPIWYAYGYARE